MRHCFATFLLLAAATVATASVLDVRLRASWEQTPILAEASEAVAAFVPESFWTFLEMTGPMAESLRRQLEAEGEAPPEPTSASPQVDQYARVLSLIPTLIFTEAQQKLARAEIASRAFSPRVRAHDILARRALEAKDAAACQGDGFIDFGEGRVICSADDFEAAMSSAATSCHKPTPVALEDEHVLAPDSSVPWAAPAAGGGCRPEMVLYGVLGTKRTSALLKLVRGAVGAGRATAKFRHYVPDSVHLQYPLGVQGYGVTVDVKSMEYKAVDEKAKKDGEADAAAASDSSEHTLHPVPGVDVALLAQRFPGLKAKLSAFSQRASRSVSSDLDLKVWEVQKLGYQAAHKVLASPHPMDTLTDLTENFPARVGSISRIAADDAFEATTASVSTLQNMFGDGSNQLWLNDRLVDSKRLDLFNLLADMRQEEALVNRIQRVLSGAWGALTQDHLTDVRKVKDCAITSPKDGPKPRLWIDEAVPLWINDIENDDMYRSFPRSVSSITQTGPYGQPRFARQNLLNMIYVINPTRRTDIEAISSFMRIYQQGAAVRFGFLFAFPEVDDATVQADENGEIVPPPSVLVAAAMDALAQTGDSAAPLLFLVRLVYGLGQSTVITPEAVRITAANMGVRKLTASEATLAYMRNQSAKVKELGLSNTPLAIFNGRVFSEGVEDALFRHFNTELMDIRQLVVDGKLKDTLKSKYAFIHSNAGAVKRYQPAVFGDAVFQVWGSKDHMELLQRLTWLFADNYAQEVATVSHVVTFNGSSAASVKQAAKALEYLARCKTSCTRSRVALLPVDTGRMSQILVSLLHKAASLGEKKRLAFVRTFLEQFLSQQGSAPLTDEREVNTNAFAVQQKLADQYRAYRAIFEWSPDHELSVLSKAAALIHHPSAVGALSSADDEAVVHTNGRVTRLDDGFAVEDFAALERLERDQRASALMDCVERVDFNVVSDKKLHGDDLTSEFYANRVFALNSILADSLERQGARVAPSTMPPAVTAGHGFTTGAPASEGRHKIVAMVDPVSRPAQKIVALLNFVARSLNASVRVHLNPPRNVQKVPLKNYYRFIATPELQFNDSAVLAPRASIRGLPTNVVLTLGIDDPDSWMVFASVADADLDNLQLRAGQQHSVSAEYTLQSLVITGTCIDVNRMSPPRGLPLEITDSDGTRDTLVMSNYGYFQLQARPGVGHLAIQDGRASDIFVLESVGGSTSPEVAVQSFGGAHLDVRVARREGHEATDLLADDGEENSKKKTGGGLFGGLFGSRPVQPWPPQEGDRDERPAKPTLNVFSLASGHLYERFLRLMIHTVMKSSSDVHGKNTTRIKFWLIENPMSPRFKRLLPHLAAKYGFEYGLVKYKWPHWLTRQTERQRMIWAYKVLFLDVLFPLDVEKIIFVDADQIVQADLHELYNMDLEGAPVAYTPFCRENARDDTKGFRFWDSGYWHDHLAGKPYHISAIYVVDLVRLRQLAAGDRYRMVYDNLAQDPNSLANLDQDLPNFAQHQVPIKSLPEEWLWCETWCSDESKPRAKTIDLCNNPRTKTPKLENAKRIVPEWEAMDRELQAFEDQVLGQDE